MKPWLKWGAAILIAGAYVACSPKKFSKDEDYMPCQNSGQQCVTQDGKDYFNYTETIEGGKVDVLFVTDNSASMSFEQDHLAARIQGFLSNLENKSVNYRIGVITTDISSGSNEPRAINGNGALQDGKLIAFPGSVGSYLTKDSGSLSDKESWFEQTVRRSETLSCEDFILKNFKSMPSDKYAAKYYEKCPSGDERGLFALNLAVGGAAGSFIRPEADLAVVILSDEDVRSALYKGQNPGNYSLDEKDTAEGFTSLMESKYPTKTYSVHSMIVKNGDSSCLSKQDAQTGGFVGASYGKEYERLTNRTDGVLGSICATDYATPLQGIFDNIESKIVDKVALACSNPEDLQVSLTNNSDPSITWTVVGAEVRFSQKLPVGTTVKVQYACVSL